MGSKYLISDPCYVIKDEHWDEFVSNMLAEENAHPPYLNYGLFKVNGHDLFAHYTKWGDGYFSSNIPGVSFGVDGGAIGCIPVELCKPAEDIRGEYYEIELEDLNSSCSYSDGLFTLGSVTIET
jgi:hypothetical protein